MNKESKTNSKKKEEKNQVKKPNNKLKMSNENDIREANEYIEGKKIFDKLPPEVKEVTQVMMAMGEVGSKSSFLKPKLNEKHIDKILDLSEKDSDRKFKDAQQSRKYSLFYLLVGAAFFVFLTLFLVGKDPDLFKEIVKLFIIFVGGMGAGYGVKSYTSK